MPAAISDPGASSLDRSGPPAATGVAVVIPTYNYGHFLPAAIDSALAQSYAPLEVIVVDDGSTDGTDELVARYTDPRVRYIRQENAGLSAARNRGIQVSRMPFVGFLDADDRWLPGFLDEVMGKFGCLGGQFAVVATITARMDQAGRPLPAPRFGFARGGELTARDFVLRNQPLASSIVARRAVFDECGLFDPALRSSEDRDMWIRITATRRFWLIDRPLALIRRHTSNMSKNAVQMKRNSCAVMLKAWRSGAVSRRDVPFWLRAFSVQFFLIAWTHFDAGFRARALGYLAISVFLWPVFLEPARISEPPLFRLRALVHFCVRPLAGEKPAQAD